MNACDDWTHFWGAPLSLRWRSVSRGEGARNHARRSGDSARINSCADDSGGPAPTRGSAKSEWHVLIALFDSQTGRRIEQAAVLVRAAPLGLSGVEKSLEPMTVAGSVTFGNYFEFSRPGPHLISVSVRISGHSNPIRVSFDHSMP